MVVVTTLCSLRGYVKIAKVIKFLVRVRSTSPRLLPSRRQWLLPRHVLVNSGWSIDLRGRHASLTPPSNTSYFLELQTFANVSVATEIYDATEAFQRRL